MGGPCLLESGAHAPACTDNFQVARFNFDGKEWDSCEQCYQVHLVPATKIGASKIHLLIAGMQEFGPRLLGGHSQYQAGETMLRHTQAVSMNAQVKGKSDSHHGTEPFGAVL